MASRGRVRSCPVHGCSRATSEPVPEVAIATIVAGVGLSDLIDSVVAWGAPLALALGDSSPCVDATIAIAVRVVAGADPRGQRVILVVAALHLAYIGIAHVCMWAGREVGVGWVFLVAPHVVVGQLLGGLELVVAVDGVAQGSPPPVVATALAVEHLGVFALVMWLVLGLTRVGVVAEACATVLKGDILEHDARLRAGLHSVARLLGPEAEVPIGGDVGEAAEEGGRCFVRPRELVDVDRIAQGPPLEQSVGVALLVVDLRVLRLGRRVVVVAEALVVVLDRDVL